MSRGLRYLIASVVALTVLSLAYWLWPWSGAILGLIAIAAIFNFLNKFKWHKTAKWAAGIGIFLVVVFLGNHYVSKNSDKPKGVKAATAEEIPIVRETLSPAKPLLLVVKSGHRVDVWPEDESAIDHSWSQSGATYILTLNAKKDTAVEYRIYMCTALMPCDSKPPL